MTEENPQKAEICYCIALRRASRRLTEHYETVMAPSGLKITQFALLRVLHRFGGLTINELSKIIDLDRTTLVRNLKLLKDKKLLSMGAKKKSRAYLIELTEHGLEIYNSALPYWEKSQEFLKDYLPADRFGEFLRVLKELNNI